MKMLDPPENLSDLHQPVGVVNPIDANENLLKPIDLTHSQGTNPNQNIDIAGDVYQNLNPNNLGGQVQAALNDIGGSLSESVLKDSVKKSLKDLHVDIPKDSADLESLNTGSDVTRELPNVPIEEDPFQRDKSEGNGQSKDGGPVPPSTGPSTSLTRGVGPRELPTIKGKQYIVRKKMEIMPARRVPKYIPDVDGGMWKVWPYPDLIELSTDSEEELVPLPEGLRWDGYNVVNPDGTTADPSIFAPTWFKKTTQWIYWLLQSLNLFTISRWLWSFFTAWATKEDTNDKPDDMSDTDTGSLDTD